MRIAYLVNQYPKVSHSFIRREILALERLGFQISRIALRGWDDDAIDEEDSLERNHTRYVLRDGVLVLLLATLRTLLTRPRQFLRALALACRMGRRAERPLPVHFVYLSEACRIQLWLRKMRIAHLHAHFGTNSAEVAMLVNALGGPSWSFTVHGPEEFDKAILIGLAEKIRRCSFVVAISSFGRSQLFRIIDHSLWNKVKIVHCGLEPEFYNGPQMPILPSQTLVCVGRLCEQKGQLLLIEAMRCLREAGTDVELVLVGDGELRPEIESLIARHKLSDAIRITGWVSGTRVREEIQSARALILPSFAEGLPVVLMEAMSLGRPVISTFVAGIPELVQDREQGWLVPAGDVEALAHTIQVCFDTPNGELLLMGRRGRECILLRHDVNKEALKLAALFRINNLDSN